MHGEVTFGTEQTRRHTKTHTYEYVRSMYIYTDTTAKRSLSMNSALPGRQALRGRPGDVWPSIRSKQAGISAVGALNDGRSLRSHRPTIHTYVATWSTAVRMHVHT